MSKKLVEMRKLSITDLEKRIKELRHELVDLTMRHEAGQLSNTASLSLKKKVLARMLTILKERNSLSVVKEGEKDVKKA
jgi:large subunit ribosomal protein L29